MCAEARSRSEDALAALEAQVARDLERIEVPFRSWVPPREGEGHEFLDVVVIGAGLSGLAIAFGLRLKGVERVRVIDAAPKGLEGPWITSARMRTLRSPKELTGPDLGIPSLTYRAWHEASFGIEDWKRLYRIDRSDWMDYLVWFRHMTGLDIVNDTRLKTIHGADEGVRLELESAGRPSCLMTRKVVLATGMEGAGGLVVPDFIDDSVPRNRWTHSGEVRDLSILSGKDVGVIGAATSSFDWAVAALEAGARSVTQLARRGTLARTEVLEWSNFAGFLNHFSELDDLRRYRFTRRMISFLTPPTQDMFDRAVSHDNYRFLLDTPVEAVRMAGDTVEVVSSKDRVFHFDHLLLGTGYAIDIARRPELSQAQDNIAVWKDRFTPPEGEADSGLLSYPYLGQGFQFTEKKPGLTPWLRNVYVFNTCAVLSLGPVCNGITGLKAGVPKIVAGLTRDLFIEDADRHYRALDAYDKIHFNPVFPSRET